MRLSSALLLGATLAMTSLANATLISDRTTFEASLNNIILDDYENAGYAFSQTDAQMSAVIGETQYSTTGFNNNDLVFGNGTNHLFCGGCNGSFELDFTSTSVSGSSGVFGVGFDFFNQYDPLYNAYVTYGDGTTENFILDQIGYPGTQFFGITSDLGISTIAFGLPNGGTTTSGSFGIDDLTIGDTTAVPEPSAISLLGFALIGLGLSRKRKS